MTHGAEAIGHDILAEDAAPDALAAFVFPPNTRTIAVVEGARVFGLRELLAEAGAEHLCLFDISQNDGMGDTAPWIFVADPKSDLTQRLLSPAPGPQGFLAAKATVFLTTDQPLAEVRDHLRRLHRLPPTDDGRQQILRIWAPETMHALRPFLRRRPDLVAAVFGTGIRAITLPHPTGAAWWRLRPQEAVREAKRLTLDPPLVQRLTLAGRAMRALRLGQDAEALIRDRSPTLVPPMDALPLRRRYAYARRIDAMGIERPETTAELLAIIYATGMDITSEPAFHYATRNPMLIPEAKARQLTMAFHMIARMQQEG
ncbi:DUF4123 domain-containing protein [Jannaschia pohangensis]|uniref:DUF4123 domain-containing protein n=1 Tax=Jannaschia pohangensis TaxID=390807 RepID=A0A1I3SUS5_9RHOB|nr:DUF4123 domain-containing protein [Jannaschia pohangensis]SFJ61301.1 protein of unknown function [Jannaschia pohangensis]